MQSVDHACTVTHQPYGSDTVGHWHAHSKASFDSAVCSPCYNNCWCITILSTSHAIWSIPDSLYTRIRIYYTGSSGFYYTSNYFTGTKVLLSMIIIMPWLQYFLVYCELIKGMYNHKYQQVIHTSTCGYTLVMWSGNDTGLSHKFYHMTDDTHVLLPW